MIHKTESVANLLRVNGCLSLGRRARVVIGGNGGRAGDLTVESE